MTLVLIVALVAVGCSTVPKSSIGHIDVPPGLSPQQIEFAILAALADDPPPEDLSPEVEITDRALKAWFGWRYKSMSTRGKSNRWFLEGRSPGRITAGTERGSHYLRVGISHNSNRIDFKIEESRNLAETSDRIHEHAVLWIQNLEIEIRRILGQLSIG